MSKPARIILPLILVALIFVAAAWITIRNSAPHPSALIPDDKVTTLSIPPFSLITQDPAHPAITQEALLGHLTIIDFMFTNCPFVCPIMTETMVAVSQDLRDTPVRFLSISVDPDHDTPERLREFAKLHNTDLSRWTFATAAGKPAADAHAEIQSIVTGGLKFALQSDPKTPINIVNSSASSASASPETMFNINHPSWFVLTGPDAKVLGIYLSGDPDQMAELKARVRAAAKEMKK